LGSIFILIFTGTYFNQNFSEQHGAANTLGHAVWVCQCLKRVKTSRKSHPQPRVAMETN